MYMPSAWIGQEQLLGSERIPANFSEIFEVTALPGLLARNRERALTSSLEQQAVYEDLTRALFKLDGYGIRAQGIGCLATKQIARDSEEMIEVFSTNPFINGSNMHDDMLLIPPSKLRETFSKIVNYYEDMRGDYSDELYFTDVSLTQCIYGVPEDINNTFSAGPDSYFIDYEPRLSNLKTMLADQRLMRVKTNRGFRGLTGLDNDLEALIRNFPDEIFDKEAARLLQLGQSLGLSYWVPTAWEHMNLAHEKAH